MDENYDFTNDFKEYLMFCLNEWFKGTYYAPVVSICQSSGNGKSRLMNEFAKKQCSVYICLRDDTNVIAFPRESEIRTNFLYAMNSYVSGNK